MANYLYNGVELPALPEWDKTVYPYAVISKHTPILGVGSNGYYLYCLGANSYYFEADTGVYFGGDSDDVAVPGIQYKLTDGVWELQGYYDNRNCSVTDSSSSEKVWSNFDMEYNGTLYFAASDPVPVTTTDPESTLMGYLVGCRL